MSAEAPGAEPPWTIERLVPGGDGFARLPDGRAAFAAGTAPGDQIRATAVDSRKSYARAKTWELVSAGRARVDPPCPVAERCGGCDWMHLRRADQLTAKAGLVREALTRTGGFREPPVDAEPVSVGGSLGYRGRLRLHVDAAGRIGLFAAKTNDVVEIPGCPVCAPSIEAALHAVRQAAARHPEAARALSEIEIREAPGGPPISVRLMPRPDPRARLPSAFIEDLEKDYAVTVAGRRGRPGVIQCWPLFQGVELSAPPAVFTQVNWAVNRALVETLVDRAQRRGLESFCDFYCGAGNFSLALAKSGLSGAGIDDDERAIRVARRSARDAGLDGVEFFAGDVRARVADLLASTQRFDLVVLDPPRSGAKSLLALLAQLAAPWIAYCSCDPVTLARDLKTLASDGYALDAVTAFDMFPHTHHVETLAWLKRVGD